MKIRKKRRSTQNKEDLAGMKMQVCIRYEKLQIKRKQFKKQKKLKI